MKILSLIILAIYMIVFLCNSFDQKNKVERVMSFILFLATCIPFFYIAGI